jgi:methylglutaconyl-CoA hydratase
MPKPVVGRINGSCYGGALGFVAACDMAISPVTARFSFSEVRLGAVATGALVHCAQRMGLTATLRFALTGEVFDAGQAVSAGLLTVAVDDDSFEEATERMISQLLLGGPMALAQTKSLVRGVLSTNVDDSEHLAMKITKLMADHEEFAEGRDAFFAGRPPKWTL